MRIDFTGEEIQKISSNFIDVIEAVISPTDTEAMNVKLYALVLVRAPKQRWQKSQRKKQSCRSVRWSV